MTMSDSRNGERTLARRVFMILAAMSLATLVLAVTGRADQQADEPDGATQIAMAPTRGPLVSRSALTSSGGTKLFHSVAGGRAFHLTQACVENTAMEVEIRSASGTFSVGTRGCHSFQPAYVVDGAATFHCKNRSGLERSCSITGHTVGDVAAGRRAVFVDVED
jgi:hypothetical protein